MLLWFVLRCQLISIFNILWLMTPHPFRMSPAGHDMFGACDAFKLKVGGYFEGFCYCGKQHIVRTHVADFVW